MILFPNHERGTIILDELPNSLAIAVISDTCRVERLFITAFLSEFSLYICIIMLSYKLSGWSYRSGYTSLSIVRFFATGANVNGPYNYVQDSSENTTTYRILRKVGKGGIAIMVALPLIHSFKNIDQQQDDVTGLEEVYQRLPYLSYYKKMIRLDRHFVSALKTIQSFLRPAFGKITSGHIHASSI